MPEMFRFLLKNGIVGILAGWASLVLFLIFDVGGIGGVVFSSANPFLPLALLAAGFAITFGSLAMGAAVMAMPYIGQDGQNGGLKVMTRLASLVERHVLRQPQQGHIPEAVPARGGRSRIMRMK
jgi:hypothetical protein